MSIRIILADDHRIFREALLSHLALENDLQVVAEAASGAEALALAALLVPDVLVLDIALPDQSGIDVARKIAQTLPSVGIVALTGHGDPGHVEGMLKAGARAYVVKTASASDLSRAIRAVAAGQDYLSSDAAGALVRRCSTEGDDRRGSASVLGRREREVLGLLAKGRRSAEIAQALGISVGTVDAHRRNIKRKLGLHTTVELARYALRAGLASLDEP
jgi:two-component system NarL family response regulator